MVQKATVFKVADEEYIVKASEEVPEGTIYITEIDGHDFCILESFQEKDQKRAALKTPK